MALNLVAELEERLGKHARGLWKDAGDFSFVLTEPDVSAHGDLATSVALALGKKIGRNPMDVANEFAESLRASQLGTTYFSKIEVARPGFVNFFLNEQLLVDELDRFLKRLGEAGSKKEKIVLEHTNVNPNKAMHIGHLRNAILGDVIKRVLARLGFKVEVQYYVDDTGVQVADTFVGLNEFSLKQKKDEKFDHFCWRVYAAVNEAYEKEPHLLEKRKEALRVLEDRGSDVAADVKKIAEKIVRDHLSSMDAFSIGYDVLVWESDILQRGFWNAAFEILKKSKKFVQEKAGKNAGCWVLKSGEETTDEEHSPDKVIVKSDGTVTYTGKDIAYHLWKFNLLGKDFLYGDWQQGLHTTSPGGEPSDRFGRADYVYNVIDVRQSYPQAMVKLALKELGYAKQAERLKHVSYGVVSLSAATATVLGTGDGGKSVAMSGRKGIGVKVDDLLGAVEKKVSEQKYEVESARATKAVSPRQVAVGAIKYFMMRYNPQTDIVFDFDEALTLEGNTGPYIQYAHARAAGILEKAGFKKTSKLTTLALAPEERRLLATLYRWPAVLERVGEDLSANLITNYAFELADAFNAFYEACPVLKAEGAVRDQRLALVYAFKAVIGDVLSILGITAPERM